MDEIGKKIVELRGEGLSQRQLARRAGIEQATLSRIENGEMALVSPHLQKIAKALNVEPSVILGSASLDFHKAEIGSRRLPVWDYTTAASFVYSSPHDRAKGGQQYVLTDRDYPPGTFGLLVTDDSMKPMITKGMVGIIDPTRETRPNSVVAVKYRDSGREVVALRYFHDRGAGPEGQKRFEAVPANLAYRTLFSDEPEVAVVGVVVEDRRFYDQEPEFTGSLLG